MWQQREQLSSKFNQDISTSGYFDASSWPPAPTENRGSVPRRGYNPGGGSVKYWSDAHGNRAPGALCNLCESVREVFGANRENWRIL
jgi:hypothetical protein